MLKLKSLDKFNIKDRGLMAVVANPSTCQNFKHLYGYMEIDGKIEYVAAVERFAHCPPWWEGEKIGLYLK